jgi:Cu2+-exporting ATPase
MAMSAASQGLARRGFLITHSRVLESLNRVDRILFDKTGTLTQGRPSVSRVVLCGDLSETEAIEIARALERDSTHPVAHAFLDGTQSAAIESAQRNGVDRRFGDGEAQGRTETVTNRENISGAGVAGVLAGRRFRLGRPDWVLGAADSLPLEASSMGPEEARVWIVLADDDRPLAWFGLEDPVRDDVEAMLDTLRDRGLALEMLSGDPSPAAPALARQLRLERVCPAATPEGKLQRIRSLQAKGERVAIVGDGVNDSPSLRAADVSIGMGSGCDLTRLNADAVLLNDDLSVLPEALDWARRTRGVIIQNLSWAVGYNLVALPLAISGQLAPWMAALGMSMSSLVVVLNALRLKAGDDRR